jgi:hypothetical protein
MEGLCDDYVEHTQYGADADVMDTARWCTLD